MSKKQSRTRRGRGGGAGAGGRRVPPPAGQAAKKREVPRLGAPGQEVIPREEVAGAPLAKVVRVGAISDPYAQPLTCEACRRRSEVDPGLGEGLIVVPWTCAACGRIQATLLGFRCGGRLYEVRRAWAVGVDLRVSLLRGRQYGLERGGRAWVQDTPPCPDSFRPRRRRG